MKMRLTTVRVCCTLCHVVSIYFLSKSCAHIRLIPAIFENIGWHICTVNSILYKYVKCAHTTMINKPHQQTNGGKHFAIQRKSRVINHSDAAPNKK